MRIFVILLICFLGLITIQPGEAFAQGWTPAEATCEFDGGLTTYTITAEDNPQLVKPCITGEDPSGNVLVMEVMASAVCVVRAVMAQAMFDVYCEIARGMRPIFMILMTLYVILYGISFIFGIADVDGRDFAIRLAKIMVLYSIAYNPEFFYRTMYLSWFALIDGIGQAMSVLYPAEYFTPEYQASMDQSALLAAKYGSTYQGGSGHLGFFVHLDHLFQQLVGKEQLYGLMLMAVTFLFSGSGFWVGMLIMIGVITVLISIIMVVVVYTTAVIALNYLLLFTPIFFAMFLFKPTQKVANGWMAAIISYTLQPILIYIIVMIVGSTLSAGDAIMDILEPADAGVCASARSSMELRCSPGPSFDPSLCVAEQENVEVSCYPAAVALQSEIEFQVGLANVAIVNVPKFRQEPVTIDPLTGLATDPPPLDGSPTEITTNFNLLKNKALRNIVAFIIIGAIVGQFVSFAPMLAQRLSIWRSQRATPVIGETQGMGSLFGGNQDRGTFGITSWFGVIAGRGISAAANYKGSTALGAIATGAAYMLGGKETAARDSSSAHSISTETTGREQYAAAGISDKTTYRFGVGKEGGLQASNFVTKSKSPRDASFASGSSTDPENVVWTPRGHLSDFWASSLPGDYGTVKRDARNFFRKLNPIKYKIKKDDDGNDDGGSWA
ncbi:MAG: type IV secretion system protein [Rickettsiales bacterium]|nr:type IV secretion system protein [Rickettsiales bacterium]